MRVDKERLLRCLNPQSIAVVGGREAERVLEQTRKLGFAGDLYAVNPKRETLCGVPCILDIDELPVAPDVVFVGIPAEPTIELVTRLNALGAGGVVCLASGFSEVGTDGSGRQRRLQEAAGSMPVIGPNCYGYINTLIGAALFPDQHGLGRTDSGVAIVSSSGNIGINFTLQQRGLPIAWLVTVGNQAVVGVEEVFSAALENDRIHAIGLHIEGLRDLALFSRLAVRAQQKGKPVIVLKTGISEAGSRITMSHTATLAGENGLYEALFRRLGVGRVNTIESFLETLKLACVTGPLNSDRIGSMSCSGGEASLIADLAVGRKVYFPDMHAEHRKRVQDTLNDYVNVDNPLDYHTFIWGDVQRMTDTFAAMMGGGYAITILVIDFPYINNCDMDEWIDAVRAFVVASKIAGAKSAVVTCLSENMTPGIRKELMDAGVVPLHGMLPALDAIETLSLIGSRWGMGLNVPVFPDQGREAAEPESCPAGQGDILALDEREAKALIHDYGIAVPRSFVAQSVAELQEKFAAGSISWPVVVKCLSDTLSHKSEMGAVVLDVDSAQGLEDAASRLLELSGMILVEEMVSGTIVELLVGVTRDPQFGHYLTLGYGGTLVEVFADSRILLLPVGDDDVTEALGSLRTARLFDGYRGKPAADVDAVKGIVQSIQQLLSDNHRNLVELELNPVLVKAIGSGAVAVDALARFERESK